MNSQLNCPYKPNFFIVGMPRSGTTSLYTYLKQHPEIYLSVFKEPHFFIKDLTQPEINITDEEVYYSLFADAGGRKRIGEASVWYMTSKTAAFEIKKFNPVSKIIIMLRNPVDMMYSLHSLYTRTGNEDVPDFQEALNIQQQRMKGACLPAGCYFPEGLLYTEVAKYYEKTKRFVDVFGMDNIHFVIFDDFAADTAESYKKTLEFLEVDAGFKAELDLKKAAALIRPMVLHQVRHAHPEVKMKLSRKMGDTHHGPRRSPLTPEQKSRLQALFKGDIENTSELINRDLTHWVRKEKL